MRWRMGVSGVCAQSRLENSRVRPAASFSQVFRLGPTRIFEWAHGCAAGPTAQLSSARPEERPTFGNASPQIYYLNSCHVRGARERTNGQGRRAPRCQSQTRGSGIFTVHTNGPHSRMANSKLPRAHHARSNAGNRTCTNASATDAASAWQACRLSATTTPSTSPSPSPSSASPPAPRSTVAACAPSCAPCCTRSACPTLSRRRWSAARRQSVAL